MALLSPTASFWKSFTVPSEYSSRRKTGFVISMLRSVTGVTNEGDFSSDVGRVDGFFRVVLRSGGAACGVDFLLWCCGGVSSMATRDLTIPAVCVCVCGGDFVAVCVCVCGGDLVAVCGCGGDFACLAGGGDVLVVVVVVFGLVVVVVSVVVVVVVVILAW